MSNLAERVVAAAKHYFAQGYNCAESTFLAGRNELLEDYDEEVPSSVASCFGGGIALTGSVCGALSGVFMVIGLIYNRLAADDKELAMKIYETALSIHKDFAERFGTVNCRELTGYDFPEEFSRFAADKEARQKCYDYVEYAAELLVKELQKRQKI
ncbi:MAG: C_GCAxxG_C_C family protein [Firmicutes bacterium]|nr:C_GCAxxG_C_C family protein [Bacillota bacterium]